MSEEEPQPLRGWQFQSGAPDWRILSMSGAAAWFTTRSHREAAALVRRIADLADAGPTTTSGVPPRIDLRADGVQIRIPADSLTTTDLAFAENVSAAARELGLTPDPSVPQDLDWSIDTLDKPTLLPFWQTLLGYQDTTYDDLLDPLGRDPRVWFYQAAPRPLRNRIHFDVSVPREIAFERARAVRAYGARETYAPDDGHPLLSDAEGNEVDLCPADQLADQPETADWWTPFGGMVCYPTRGLRQSATLADAVAEVADSIGLPLLVDIRGFGVIVDTGKDQWEDQRFPETARRVQAIARDLGLVADPTRLRFIQAGIDAVDIPRVRAFWRAVLGYQNDPREFVTDIFDPHRLNHPMFFQPLDPSDTGRRAQRNRIHLDLYVPDDQVQSRIEAALAAGGRLTREGGATIADPEGNEVDIGKGIADPTF